MSYTACVAAPLIDTVGLIADNSSKESNPVPGSNSIRISASLCLNTKGIASMVGETEVFSATRKSDLEKL